MATEYIDLLLLNGEIIRIEVPEKYIDEAYDAIGNAMKRRDWWSVQMLDGCKAEYLGVYIDRIAMNQVVAML